MDCKCGGIFLSKKDTFMMAWKQKIATIVMVCDKCGAQRTVYLTPGSIHDEEGVHGI
jgi:hypothetical protein